MSGDPWECFGDDSSIDEIEEQKDQTENRLRLINRANNHSAKEQKGTCTTNNGDNDDNDDNANNRNSNDKEDVFKTKEKTDSSQKTDIMNYISINLPPTIKMWSHRPPLYFGQMAVVEDPAFHRGYIATENLSPGTLLLVEEPIFRWPLEQIGSELGLMSILALLEHECAQDIVNDMEYLYPTRDDVDAICMGEGRVEMDDPQKLQIKDMIDILTMQYGGDKQLERVLSTAKRNRISKSQKRSENATLDEIDMFRMLLTLRYNGFDSGLYLHFAMFNHSCDANCVKFMPENDVNMNDNKTRKYSEVRTTKHVRKGEPLTLHYLNPREVSHATRRLHIWEQHRFDLGSNMICHTKQLQEMDHVNGSLPSSSKEKEDNERITFLVEKSLKDLQDLFRDLNVASRNNLSNDEAIEMFEHCKALEIATEEMIHASCKKLNNSRHLLLIRCCRLHLDSSEMLLRVGTSGLPSINLTNKQQLEIMKKFVRTCHTLLSLQKQYLGGDHPDVARTNYDLAMGINSLLSRSPKTLFSLNLSGLQTLNGCQRYEGECRKDHHRIDALYPRDVEEKIKEDYYNK